jgi:hypothetical protein
MVPTKSDYNNINRDLIKWLPRYFFYKLPSHSTNQVAKAQDSLSVGNDDGSDIVLRPVPQDVVHVTLVVDRDKKTLKKQNFQSFSKL